MYEFLIKFMYKLFTNPWGHPSTEPLKQCCPTLSQFATCGDKRFKYGNRHLFRTVVNSLHILHIMTKVAKVKLLSQQLWRMWRQRECGWTPLLQNISQGLLCHSTVQLTLDLKQGTRSEWVGWSKYIFNCVKSFRDAPLATHIVLHKRAKFALQKLFAN